MTDRATGPAEKAFERPVVPVPPLQLETEPPSRPESGTPKAPRWSCSRGRQHPPEQIQQLLEGLSKYYMAVGARTSIRIRARTKPCKPHLKFFCQLRLRTKDRGPHRRFTGRGGRMAREFETLLPNPFSYPTTITPATCDRATYSLINFR